LSRSLRGGVHDRPDDSPDVVALRFVDRINQRDVAGLAALMTEDHELRVFDEDPQRGRTLVADAWDGYIRAFPRYVISSRRVGVVDDQVAILGHTTGSHLGLPDEEEATMTLIWVARIVGGLVASWTLIDGTPENRRAFSLDGQAASR
jgi:hypothetical protein